MRFAASADVAADPGFRGRERMAMGGPRENSTSVSSFGVSSFGLSPLGLYRLYYDAIRRGWFVRGVYD